MPHRDVFTKAEIIAMVERAGFDQGTISSLETELSDEVDVRRDEALLARHGVSRNELIARMGGSP